MYRDICHVASAELLSNDTNPKQFSLLIRGIHRDGCRFPVLSVQSREENRIQIQAFREMRDDIACPAVVLGFTAVIELEGEFEAGTIINVQVNNFSFSQEIRRQYLAS